MPVAKPENPLSLYVCFVIHPCPFQLVASAYNQYYDRFPFAFGYHLKSIDIQIT